MKAIVLALLGTLAAACSPATRSAEAPQIHTASSPRVGLTHYRTFSFGLAQGPHPSYTDSPWSLEAESHMRELISSALREKGYVEDDSKPNFLVAFGAGTKKLGSEGNPSWYSVDDNIDVRRVDVEIYDAFTRAEVWSGSVVWQRNVRETTDEGRLPHNVQGLLATFPVRSPEASDSANAQATGVEVPSR
jgi:uncharacterized protein DUF4136